MYCIIMQYHTKSLECIGIGWFFITQQYQYQTSEMWLCTHVLQQNSPLANGGMIEPVKCVQKFLSSEDVQLFVSVASIVLHIFFGKPHILPDLDWEADFPLQLIVCSCC